MNLAESIAAPSNPLTYRVIVNRLWFYAFGRGLVNTPDNFGRLGDEPSHPELLDYLAARFQKEGTSLKSMLKLLLTSRAFRLDHHASEDAAARDPENKCLSHFSARRLDAEAVRDSLIARAGNMDFTTGGESVGGGSNRRSVYLRVIRNNLDPFLAAFDFPVPSATRGKRDATNVPAQSLALLNSPQVAGRANEWARKVLEKNSKSDEQRVHQMFLEAFSRMPSEKELGESLAFIASMSGAEKSVREALQDSEQSVAELRSAVAQIKQQSKESNNEQETKLSIDLAKAEAHVRALQEQLKTVSGRITAGAVSLRRCLTQRSSSMSAKPACCSGNFQSRALTRREALARLSNGFGMLALAGLMSDTAYAGPAKESRAKEPHFKARAKNIIFCYMSGGVSHVDTFDPKPRLRRIRQADARAGAAHAVQPERHNAALAMGVQEPRTERLAGQRTLSGNRQLRRRPLCDPFNDLEVQRARAGQSVHAQRLSVHRLSERRRVDQLWPGYRIDRTCQATSRCAPAIPEFRTAAWEFSAADSCLPRTKPRS